MPFTFSVENAQFSEDEKRIRKNRLHYLLLLFIALLEDELVDLTRRMLERDLTLGEWHAQTMRAIKAGHTAAALLGVGSSELLTGRSLRETEAQIRFSLERLNRFARLIETRTMPRARDPQAIENRIRLYARAVSETFERAHRNAHDQAGFRFERNILGAAEHCPECLAITNLGWQAIGSLKPPGTRICRGNCRCRLIYAREL